VCCNSQTRRESTGKQTSEGAIEYYESYVEDLKRQGFLLQEHFTAEATQLASEKLQAVSWLCYDCVTGGGGEVCCVIAVWFGFLFWILSHFSPGCHQTQTNTLLQPNCRDSRWAPPYPGGWLFSFQVFLKAGSYHVTLASLELIM
jgi:hypothetical protein